MFKKGLFRWIEIVVVIHNNTQIYQNVFTTCRSTPQRLKVSLTGPPFLKISTLIFSMLNFRSHLFAYTCRASSIYFVAAQDNLTAIQGRQHINTADLERHFVFTSTVGHPVCTRKSSKSLTKKLNKICDNTSPCIRP